MIGLAGDTELLSFTVQQTSDGLLFPQHGSHVSHGSHGSHSSHSSHASSSGGYGGGGGGYVPSLPDYVPPPVYAPAPVYAPPPAVTTTPTTPPPTASERDPKYLACTKAYDGFGLNDIASALVQGFGMAESDAVDMAQQALAAVFGGTHYCDEYLGDH